MTEINKELLGQRLLMFDEMTGKYTWVSPRISTKSVYNDEGVCLDDLLGTSPEYIVKVLNEIMEAAPEDYNSFKEVADALGENKDSITEIFREISKRIKMPEGGKEGQVLKFDGKYIVFADDNDTIYKHPDTHPARMIEEDPNRQFVSEAEKESWNNKLDENSDISKNKATVTIRNNNVTETVSGLFKQLLNGYVELIESKGIAGGYASLNTKGKIPTDQLPKEALQDTTYDLSPFATKKELEDISLTPGPKGEDGKPGADGRQGIDGKPGKDGISVTHSWDGSTLTITSASGTSSADLKGPKGDPGQGGDNLFKKITEEEATKRELEPGFYVIDDNYFAIVEKIGKYTFRTDYKSDWGEIQSYMWRSNSQNPNGGYWHEEKNLGDNTMDISSLEIMPLPDRLYFIYNNFNDAEYFKEFPLANKTNAGLLSPKHFEILEEGPIKGDTGPQGDPGKPGAAGADGKDGISATHSWDGSKLTMTSASGTTTTDLRGPQGVQGKQGKQGVPGADGKPGADGLPGKDGQPGKDGVDGQPGPAGKDGVDGKDGKDGTEIIFLTEAEYQALGTKAPDIVYAIYE